MKFRSEVNIERKGKIFHEEITPASKFLPPGSGFLPPGSGFLPPGLVPCLRHVYNSTYWLRLRSPAYQQGLSMLTEAPRHIMLTAAYRQAMCPLGHVPTRAPCSLGHMPPLGYAPPSGYVPPLGSAPI
ncbi:hypothetical protein F2Q69_00007518 [Brassica cretica]|uniref:Uncharacterized protein n=1 Tax=Brassica cretica TaxID=69181 RepID=A0A8S9PA91_BRACR|nr:hypothetical protein F2Q69_00007518 [Brassica cretica]